MSRIFEEKARPLPISKGMVWQAFKKVKSNKGSAGVDNVSIQKFEEDLENNLYKLWNRLASGSYFPPSVKEVEIPKDKGKTRKLGIPTVADRIGQQVVKNLIEPRLEKEFHNSSYGYRPSRSAHQALLLVKQNTRRFDWVIDLDITKFFDNVDHQKLLKALDKHIEERWIKMYIERWLTAPKLSKEGVTEQRQGKGTPQGGTISPLLANLYLHYAFDKWMDRNFPELAFVRYADDIIIHCINEGQSKEVLDKVQLRLKECGLEVHPEKTKRVYCKDYRRKKTGKAVQFDFLGFSFRPESKRTKGSGKMFLGYDCTINQKNYSKIVEVFRSLKIHRSTNYTLEDIARILNPKIRGWMQYYEKFRKTSLTCVFHRLHNRLVKWILNKHKRFKGSVKRGFDYLRGIYKSYPYLFYHWELGYPLV
jgi:group II intron reverse transcriptase/maturase